MAKRIEMNIKESDSSYEVLWPEDGRYTDEQILSDEVKTFWGLEPNAIPSDAFMAIAGVFNKTVNFTVTIDGAPAEGVTIEGFNGTAGSGELVTNSEGKCTGITTDNTINVTAKSPWIDAEDVQYNQTLSGIVSNVNIAMTSQSSGKLEITESKTIKFSPSRTQIQYCVIGGGASGSALMCDSRSSTNVDACSGSAGGNVKIGSFNNSSQQLTMTIGSGGASVAVKGRDVIKDGISGGETALSIGGSYQRSLGGKNGVASLELGNAIGLSGGDGGSGGGSAGNDYGSYWATNGGTDGSDGGKRDGFSSVVGGGQRTTTTFDGQMYSSGAGGISRKRNSSYVTGTSGSGAGASVYSSSASVKAGYGFIYGSAGGSAIATTASDTCESGAGKQGAVILKWTV